MRPRPPVAERRAEMLADAEQIALRYRAEALAAHDARRPGRLVAAVAARLRRHAELMQGRDGDFAALLVELAREMERSQ